RTWLQRAPGFNLDHVTAPLRLTALGSPEGGPDSVFGEWEMFAGLLLQGKPAELVYIPGAAHEIIKPWERMTSQQQGTVDWYRFWLQGYERTEPIAEIHETAEELAAQYTRWKKL